MLKGHANIRCSAEAMKNDTEWGERRCDNYPDKKNY
jgi:hypothetical protein